MGFNIKNKLILFTPVLMSLIAAAVDYFVPTHRRIISARIPYFSYVMLFVAAGFLISAVVSLVNTKYRARYYPKVKFYFALTVFLCLIDVLTDKAMLLPKIYFPSVNNIIACAIAEREILLMCTLYSVRLLLFGIILGGVFGVITGIIIGWNKTINYWISPITRFIGPMPTAIWIPISLLVFPSLFSSSVFIVALTMWFPTNVQTSSGIQNVSKEYYDVADTLGASTLYKIIHIAIPSAMPQMFVGIFSGITASFISLMMSELMGAKYGIGWYINWKQQIMSYANVWVGLFILALLCSITLKLLFKLRAKFLSWQEGIIRW